MPSLMQAQLLPKSRLLGPSSDSLPDALALAGLAALLSRPLMHGFIKAHTGRKPYTNRDVREKRLSLQLGVTGTRRAGQLPFLTCVFPFALPQHPPNTRALGIDKAF